MSNQTANKKRSKMRSVTVMALLAVFVGAVVVVIANKAKPGGLSALTRSLGGRDDLPDDTDVD
jgi:Na+/serine symporter